MRNLSILTLLLLLVGGKSFSAEMKIIGYSGINNCVARVSIIHTDGTIETIGSDSVINNKFTIKVMNVDKTPLMGTLSLMGTATPIVIEPGKIKARMVYGEGNIIKGGHYNKIMFASDATPEMIKLRSEMKALNSSYDFSTITKSERSIYQGKMRKIQSEIGKLSKDYITSLYNHKDNYVRLFAISLRYDISEEAMKIVSDIEAEIGTHPSIIMLRNMCTDRERADKAKVQYVVGGTIYNFTAQNVAGKDYKLSDTYSKNRYTLVEFWASWCAPCLAEGKKLMPVYEKYHPTGFEIFAFSIDESRDKWITKGEQLALKWINTHSDRTIRREVQRELAITAIPRNYLVDSKGVIIAIDIHSEELIKFLEENKL